MECINSRNEKAIEIGKRISNLLYERGKTQRDLCRDTGYDKATVSAWVTGKRVPRVSAIEKLCEYFNVPRSAILGPAGTVEDSLEPYSTAIQEQREHPETRPARPFSPTTEVDDDVERTLLLVRTLLTMDRAYLGLFDAVCDTRQEDVEAVRTVVETMNGSLRTARRDGRR